MSASQTLDKIMFNYVFAFTRWTREEIARFYQMPVPTGEPAYMNYFRFFENVKVELLY